MRSNHRAPSSAVRPENIKGLYYMYHGKPSYGFYSATGPASGTHKGLGLFAGADDSGRLLTFFPPDDGIGEYLKYLKKDVGEVLYL